MDRELIERLAREVGLPWSESEVFLKDNDNFYRFAALVAEECAMACLAEDALMQAGYREYACGEQCADAIRARFAAPSE